MDFDLAPAFAVLFHLGKTTMRPGGMELTRRMLDDLQIGPRDNVVEFAPGRGATTRLVLEHSPQSYTAIERDSVSQEKMQKLLCHEKRGRCVVGTAQATGLEDGCASAVLGEAMLTMQSRAAKLQIVREAFRILQPGGRYGIHETCLEEGVSAETKGEMEDALREVLRVGARPLATAEWRELLEETGFSIQKTHEAPMLLLEPRRMVQDEGLWGGNAVCAPRYARSRGAPPPDGDTAGL